MRRLIDYKYLAFLSLTVVISSCSKDQLGPDVQSVGVDFDASKVALVSSSTNLNEKIDQFPKITAEWKETASYELSIRGLTSGAEKVFFGTGKSLEHEWSGLSSNMQFFRKEERASIHLKIAGANEIVSEDTLLVKGPYNFDGKENCGIKYFVVENFEISEDQFKPSFPIEKIGPDANDENVLFQNTSDFSIDGDMSMLVAGSDANGNGWSGDYYHSYLGELLAKKSVGYPIDSGIDPSDLYFNLFIYGTGAPGTTIQIEAAEIDDVELKNQDEINKWITSHAENENPIDPDKNDNWIYPIPVKWEGWKLVSIPYSEFALKAVSAGGDKIKETYRISGIVVSLLSYPTAGFDTKAYIDFLTITTGGKAQYTKECEL
jgi:hypothetical protein